MYRLAIVASSSMCSDRSKRACVHVSVAVPRLLLTEEEDMSTLLIVLLVLFVLGGGGWGYSRWRA